MGIPRPSRGRIARTHELDRRNMLKHLTHSDASEPSPVASPRGAPYLLGAVPEVSKGSQNDLPEPLNPTASPVRCLRRDPPSPDTITCLPPVPRRRPRCAANDPRLAGAPRLGEAAGEMSRATRHTRTPAPPGALTWRRRGRGTTRRRPGGEERPRRPHRGSWQAFGPREGPHPGEDHREAREDLATYQSCKRAI